MFCPCLFVCLSAEFPSGCVCEANITTADQWRIQRGARGHGPLEAHVPTLRLQKSVESKAGKTRF